VEEMQREAGVRLHLVSLDTFLTQAPTYLDAKVSADTVEQAQQLPELPLSLDVPTEQLDHRKVRDILQAKRWPVRPPILWHDQTGSIPSRANAVPFKVGPGPDDPEGLITFEVGNVSQGAGGTRSVSQKVADLLRRFPGPIVVVTSSPAPVLLEWPGGQPAKTYHCGWGEFPWLQIITLDDLAAGAYNLPVQGIQELNQ
jgi:hypothetical protein